MPSSSFAIIVNVWLVLWLLFLINRLEDFDWSVEKNNPKKWHEKSCTTWEGIEVIKFLSILILLRNPGIGMVKPWYGGGGL